MNSDSHHNISRCLFCDSDCTSLQNINFKHGSEIAKTWHCQSCETAFLSPQPSDAWLADEYAGYYKRRSSGIQKLEHFRRFFKSHSPAPFRHIIEIGGGEGACARAILEVTPTAKLTVVEAHSDAAKFYSDINCKLVSAPLESWLAANHETFDLIMMFDVLEHLRDPATILRKLTSCLAPGGCIWLSVPVYDSISRRVFGRLWPQYKPEHLFYFSEKGLRTICEAQHLEAISVNRHTKHLPLSYLFSVGAGFGPRPLQLFFRLIRAITPIFFQRSVLTFCLGERLLRATKPLAKTH